MKYLILKDRIVLNLNSKTYTVLSSDVRFDKIKEYVLNDNTEELLKALDFKFLNPAVKIENGRIYFKNEVLNKELEDLLNPYLNDPDILNFLILCHDSLKNINDLTNSEVLKEIFSNAYFPIKGFPLLFYKSYSENKTKSLVRSLNLNIIDYSNAPDLIRVILDKKLPLDEIIHEIFGFNSKKLKNQILDSIHKNREFPFSLFVSGLTFKGLFTSNNFFDIIDSFQPTQNTFTAFSFQTLIKDLFDTSDGRFSEKKALNFIHRSFKENGPINKDISNLYQRVKEHLHIPINSMDFKTFNDLQEFLDKEYIKIKNKPFSVQTYLTPEFIKKIKKIKFQEDELFKDKVLKFVVPKESTDLIKWGQILHNCVGSFAQQMATGKCIILGIYHKRQVVACLEIYNNKINQLETAHFKPHVSHKTPFFLKVQEVLEDHDIINI